MYWRWGIQAMPRNEGVLFHVSYGLKGEKGVEQVRMFGRVQIRRYEIRKRILNFLTKREKVFMKNV